MKYLTFLFAIVLFADFAQAETDKIKAGLQGNAWIKFSEMEKVIYLKGIYSGIMLGQSSERENYITDAHMKTVEDGINEFYADFRNRNIFVIFALKIVSRQLRGDSLEVIDADVLRYRELFSR
ncbi:MAG: hypothetical protein WD342_00250 [Verrucomicrobiales bacterium]